MKADKQFAADVLGYKWRVGQASVEGRVYEVPSRYKAFDGCDLRYDPSLNADCYAVESPDSFYPADSSTGATIMRYGENNLVAGTAMDNGTSRTVALGFPIETVADAAARDKVIAQSLAFFSAPHRGQASQQKADKNKSKKKDKKKDKKNKNKK
jgi:hypothetical protein